MWLQYTPLDVETTLWWGTVVWLRDTLDVETTFPLLVVVVAVAPSNDREDGTMPSIFATNPNTTTTQSIDNNPNHHYGCSWIGGGVVVSCCCCCCCWMISMAMKRRMRMRMDTNWCTWCWQQRLWQDGYGICQSTTPLLAVEFSHALSFPQ